MCWSAEGPETVVCFGKVSVGCQSASYVSKVSSHQVFFVLFCFLEVCWVSEMWVVCIEVNRYAALLTVLTNASHHCFVKLNASFFPCLLQIMLAEVKIKHI